AALGLSAGRVAAPRGMAIELRVNAESMAPDGTARPAGGAVTAFEPPCGPGIRVDSAAHVGYRPGARFDSLLAKVIVSTRSGALPELAAKARRALAELRIAGVATNAAFLQSVLGHPDVAAGRVDTAFVDAHAAELAASTGQEPPVAPGAGAKLVGARVDPNDPLAVLVHGRSEPPAPGALDAEPPADVADGGAARAAATDGAVAVVAPMQGTIVSVTAREGEAVRAGDEVLVMEAMKMEHVIAAHVSGVVRAIAVARGD